MRTATLVAFALVLAVSRAASAQILVTDPGAFEGSGTLPATPVQRASPLRTHHAVTLDGLIRRPGLRQMSVAGNPWGFDPAPSRCGVDVLSRAYTPEEIDISLPAHVPWIVGRTYFASPGETTDADGPQGLNWFQTSQPELVWEGEKAEEAELLHIVFGADRFITFRRLFDGETMTDTFRGVNGASGAVVFMPDENGPDTYIYYDHQGNAATFFGFDDDASPAGGQVWRITDAAGHAAYVGNATSASEAISGGYTAQGFVSVAFDSAGRRFLYSYGAGRLTGVISQAVIGATWVEVGRVEYAYYGEAETFGRAGELKLVSRTTPLTGSAPSLVRVQHYRYRTSGHDPHAIRMVVDPEGARRFACDPDTSQLDLTTAADEAVRPFAAVELWYDSGRAVTTAVDAAAPGLTQTFSASANPNFAPAAGTYDDEWLSRTVGFDGGTYGVTYFDEFGQVLGRVACMDMPSGSPDVFWATRLVRDAAGRLVQVRTPANASGYVHTPEANAFVQSHGGQGLVFNIDRVASGPMQGFPAGLYRRAGASSGGSLHSDVGYLAVNGSEGGRRIVGDAAYPIVTPLIASLRAYPGGTAIETSNAYTFWASPGPSAAALRVQSVTVNEPVVPTTRNGTGSATPHTPGSYFTLAGERTFTRSRTGRINYAQFDAATGRIVATIEDANTTGLNPPSGFSSTGPIGDLLHRVRSYARDDQGRLVSATDPGGRTTGNYFTRLADGRVVSITVPRVEATTSGHRYFGPALCQVLSHEGTPLARFNLGPSRGDNAFAAWTTEHPAAWIDSGEADLFQAITGPGANPVAGHFCTYQYTRSGGQLLSAWRFHHTPESEPDLPPIIDPDPQGPAPDRPFDRVEFGYSDAGWLNKVVSPSGTITRVVYDPLGRPVQVWRGTDDSQGSGNNLVLLREQEWDFGYAGGNGMLTGSRRHVSATASNYTQYHYDEFGRLLGVKNPAEPHAIFAYDNLDRMTAWARLKGSGPQAPVPAPDAAGLSARVAFGVLMYDDLGRVYRTIDYPVSRTTGAIGSTGAPTDRYFGAEGSLRAVTGPVNMMCFRNRACEVTRELIYVSASPISGYTDATTLDSDDYVIEERQYIVDRSTGYVRGVAEATRGAVDCASQGAPGALFPAGLIEWEGDSFTIHNPDDLLESPWPHRMNLSRYWTDPLERPSWEENVGDPRYVQGLLPLAYDPATPPTYAQNIGGSRVRGHDYDDLGRPSVTVDPTQRATEYGYDGAGRVTRIREGTGMDGPYGGVVFVECSDDPTTTIGYDDGRPGDLRICQGATERHCRGVQFVYPDQPEIRPIDWWDNDRPIGILENDPDPSPSVDPDWIMGNTDDTTLFEYDRQGEITRTTNPGGFITERVVDHLGREVERHRIAPNSSQPTIRDLFGFDPGTGLPDDVRRYNGDTESLLARTQVTRDDWGNVSDILDSIYDDAGNFVVAPATHLGHEFLAPGGGWQAPRLANIQYPGGLPVFPRYGWCGGEPQSSPGIDALMGRPTRFDAGLGVPDNTGPPWYTPQDPPATGMVAAAVNGAYHGIWYPSLTETSTTDNDDNVLRDQPYHGIYYPDDESGIDRWGVRNSEFICAGIDCSRGSGAPWVDRTTTHDPAGRVRETGDIEHLAGRNTTYVDCSRSFKISEGDNPDPYDTEIGGNSVGDIRLEKYIVDASGAIERYEFDDDRSVVTVNEGDERRVSAYDGAWRRTSTDHTTWDAGSSQAVTVTVTPAYDAAGNLVNDGRRWVFAYDAENRLIQVNRRNGDGSTGPLYARFRYDALGRRISACYDEVGANGDLADDWIEFYAYDPAWRLTCVYRQGPEDSWGQRPSPVASERFLYRDGGLIGSDAAWAPGGGRAFPGFDVPVLAQSDEDGDGVFERTRRYMVGSRGDVLGVVEERSVTGGSYECAEIVRYSAGGVPRVIGHFGADMNESGGVPDEADIGAFFLLYGAGDPRADFNGSGGVPDDADVVLFFQVWDAGIGQGTADDNRFGWRGYMWDARLGLYHVRHRVYDPWSMSWLQRDPAWFKDGLNRYAYCRGDLENGYDPYGLWILPERRPGGDIWRIDPIHQMMLDMDFAEWIADHPLNPVNLTITILAMPIQAGIEAEDNYAKHMGYEPTEVDYLVSVLGGFVGAHDISAAAFGYSATHDRMLTPWERTVSGALGAVQFVGAGAGMYGGVVRIMSRYPGAAAGVQAGQVARALDSSEYLAKSPGRGWRVGDPINNFTKAGNVPAWSTTRGRYWKNEAHYHPERYTAAQLARMRRGLAPQRLNPSTGELESKELHHDPAQRNGNFFRFEQLWPDQHRKVDPCRR